MNFSIPAYNYPELNPYVELKYPIFGCAIPFKYGYPLYGGICRKFPVIHDLNTLSILPIYGKPEFPNLLHLTDNSQLCLRLPSNQVPFVYRLAGKTLNLNEYKIRLGLPESQLLTPYHCLYSRLIIIRGFDQPQAFLDAAKRQLDQRNITATLKLITRPEGEPIRRVLEVKGKTLVGYGVQISDLTDDDSISLQEKGIGGKHKMGCGVFVPFKHR
ncbi:MAG: type I-MYXAN CRISPR-associated protein Cas6/Cmx6 [Cyanobacteriota bacterium]|nr:type I-MYXAN CRISPR-associated protein Cas6/Cmx6 [Cyanobacteriota bacterium]